MALARMSPAPAIDRVPVAARPLTTAKSASPRTSSTTAAPRTTCAAGSCSRPRAERTRAVIPTLVAVRVAPMKTAGRVGIPQSDASPKPSASGHRTPTAATTVDWRPARRSSSRSDSRPISKRRRTTPTSASDMKTGERWTSPRTPGPIRTPARSSPRTAGCPTRSRPSPPSLAASQMTTRPTRSSPESVKRLPAGPSWGTRPDRLRRHTGQLAQQEPGPPVDVVLADDLAHPGHARRPLLRRGLHRGADRLRHLIEVVGVDQQRVAQLARAPREAAQDQHTVPVVANGDELLGDQVHPVVERGHHAEVGVTVEGPDREAIVVAFPVDDRPPAPRTDGPVHQVERVLDLELQLMVALDPAEARGRELDEDEALAVGGVALEETLEGEEPFGEPLRVVDPLDADAEKLGRNAEAVEQLLARGRGRVRHELGRDADRERLDVRRARSAYDREVLPVDTALDRALDGIEKVVAVILRVEADQVGAQHPLEDLPLPGADPEGLEVRPGDVPEERDPHVGALGLDERREQREVIVLDQHQGRLRAFDLLEDGRGELRVHAEVVLPVLGAEERPRVDDVAEGPEPLVGKAIVVPVLLLLAEPHPPERVAGVVGRQGEPTTLVRDLEVGVAAAVGDPHATAGAQDRLHRGHEATGRRLGHDPPALPHVADGLAVRHEDQRPTAEELADVLLQALFRPVRFTPEPEGGLPGGGDARAMQARGQAGDFEGQGTEQAGVRDGRGRRGLACLERPGPPRDLRQRLGDAVAHDEDRDQREDEGEDAEAQRVGLPEIALGDGQRGGVEEHRERADRRPLAVEGGRVDVGLLAVDEAEALPDDGLGDGLRDLGQRHRRVGGDVGRGGDQAREFVVDRESPVRSTELLEHALNAGRRAAGHDRLDRLLEPFADEGGAALQLVRELLLLLVDLEEREPHHDDEGRDPDAAEQPHEDAHAGRLACRASPANSRATSATSGSRCAAREGASSGPTRTVTAHGASTP